MTVTISRWGNSLAVRLPKGALEAAGLREGDVLEIAENLHRPAFDTPIRAEGW